MGTSISAGVIPINSMYDGDEGDKEEKNASKTPVIEETKEEHVQSPEEAQQEATES